MITLEAVYHFPKAMALIAMIETLGNDWPIYVCPFCQVEREHYQKRTDGGRLLAICSECAQGSIVREEKDQ
jgi:hypothetical protein